MYSNDMIRAGMSLIMIIGLYDLIYTFIYAVAIWLFVMNGYEKRKNVVSKVYARIEG